MNYRHYCVQFTLSIRAELKLKYREWYGESLFLEQLNTHSFPGVLILPSQVLIENGGLIKSPKIIAFGDSGQLEAAFLAGAHDYLKDPWDCEELIIRSTSKRKNSYLRIKNHNIYISPEQFTIDSRIINLSEFQNRLLYLMILHSNKILLYKEIQEYLGMTCPHPVNSLHVHINRIRRILSVALPDIYGEFLLIENRRSLGYGLKVICG